MPFVPGLQTHFNAAVPASDLAAVRGFGFRSARIDCQTVSVSTMQTLVADARAADLTPLPIVGDLDRLSALEPPLDVEWGNEPDGDILPRDYRPGFDAACALALERGLRLWGPAISNLDQNSLLWLARVLAVGDGYWPPGLTGISVHRYGDGTFAYAHPGFATREEEVAALQDLCQGLPFIVTEFGYPSKPVRQFATRPKRMKYLQPGLALTEDEQAARISQEWAFWAPYTERAYLYQINDGIHADEGYGIRRCLPDGTLTDWKPAAYTVPPEEGPMAELASVTANTVFAKEDLVPVEGREGEYGLRCPPGAATILSPKTSGHHELRDMDHLGAADETCKVVGDLVYFWQNSQGGRFAWRIVE